MIIVWAMLIVWSMSMSWKHKYFFFINIYYDDKRQNAIEALSIEKYYLYATTQYLSLSFMGSSRRCRGRFFRTGDRICIGWLIGAHLHQSPGHQSQRWWWPVLFGHFLQGAPQEHGQLPVQWQQRGWGSGKQGGGRGLEQGWCCGGSESGAGEGGEGVWAIVVTTGIKPRA